MVLMCFQANFGSAAAALQQPDRPMDTVFAFNYIPVKGSSSSPRVLHLLIIADCYIACLHPPSYGQRSAAALSTTLVGMFRIWLLSRSRGPSTMTVSLCSISRARLPRAQTLRACRCGRPLKALPLHGCAKAITSHESQSFEGVLPNVA